MRDAINMASRARHCAQQQAVPHQRSGSRGRRMLNKLAACAQRSVQQQRAALQTFFCSEVDLSRSCSSRFEVSCTRQAVMFQYHLVAEGDLHPGEMWGGDLAVKAYC